MKSIDIPKWLYILLRAIFLVGFTVPFFLWGGQLLGMSQKTEQTLITGSISELKQVERKGDNLLSSIQTSHILHGKKSTKVVVDSSVLGIDVSHYQGIVRWDKVAKSGYKFAFAKATGGTTYTDPKFYQNWHGMRAAELYRGAYHFFYAADDPAEQASHFLNTIGKLSKNDFPPVLDVEIFDHTKPKVLLERVLIWLEIVKKATGRTPILYIDNGFSDAVLTDPHLSEYPLWIADYAKKVDTLPKPWKKSGWLMWQYSQEGKVDGVTGEVDMNRFSGSLSDLTAFISDTKSKVR